jgi:uncharacterized protein YkwD
MSRHLHSRRARVLAAVVGAVAPAALPAPALAIGGSVADRAAQEVRKCANKERAKRGLPHLTENPVLDKAARFHAKNMARQNFFDHTDPQGRGPAERIDIFGSWEAFNGIGENIAAGEDGPAQACRDWMESPGHRENILDPKFHAVGGGFAMGDTDYRFYYVQEFGERNVGAPAPKPKSDPANRSVVVVRLFNAQDSLTVSLDGRPRATVHPGQQRTVTLGRLGPEARIKVEAFSSGSYLSWGIEEHTGKRRVYRDTRSIGARSPSTEPTVDLANGPAPLVHRVILDASGRVLASSSVHPPRLPGPTAQSPLSRWR